ncbi:unnamed protein product [Caenorhabditis sp. 36 PRJEB53466]|nr:unnamed protein product [Caenorhabditis sp. 36 PRJEB53466]
MASRQEEVEEGPKRSSQSAGDVSPSPSLQGTTATKTGTTTISEQPADEREGFGNKAEFVLTCLGLAVGLGNIWRFPTRAYENGGSAFLIPYLTCAFLFGFPSLYFEFLLGQYQGKSPPIVFRRVMPILEGVGWMGPIVAALVAIYYILLIAWISIYILNIFRGHFNVWNKCDNEWNLVSTCIDLLSQKKCRVANPPGWNGTNVTIPEKLYYMEGTCKDAANYANVSLVSATEQYFMRYIINPSTSLLDFDSINWPVLGAMTACWLLTGLGIVKGAKIIGKISYVSVILPYIIVVVLFIRGVTLEGASQGLYYYFGKPDYAKLLHTKTWTEALKQLCFSLSVGHGGLMTLSSYSKKNNNVFRDALIVIIGDTMMSLVGGAAVFSTLGFLATQRGVTVPEVVKSGLSLAFVVYPEAMTQMPLPWLWSFLFFFMLFLLGASTEIALVEVFCSCLYDQNKSLRNKKWLVVMIWCLVLYAVGFVFSTGAGMYWFELFDEYAAGFSSVCTMFCELIVVMWIYGWRNLREDITEVLGNAKNRCTKAIGPHSPYLMVNWMFISPLIATVLVALSFIRSYPYEGKPDVYPPLFDVFGWFVSFIPVLMIPLFAGLNYYKSRKHGHTVKSLMMLQKQHVSYPRISQNFDEDQKALQDQLPELEPWDEEPESESEPTRKVASGDVAIIDVSSSENQIY